MVGRLVGVHQHECRLFFCMYSWPTVHVEYCNDIYFSILRLFLFLLRLFVPQNLDILFNDDLHRKIGIHHIYGEHWIHHCRRQWHFQLAPKNSFYNQYSYDTCISHTSTVYFDANNHFICKHVYMPMSAECSMHATAQFRTRKCSSDHKWCLIDYYYHWILCYHQ